MGRAGRHGRQKQAQRQRERGKAGRWLLPQMNHTGCDLDRKFELWVGGEEVGRALG